MKLSISILLTLFVLSSFAQDSVRLNSLRSIANTLNASISELSDSLEAVQNEIEKIEIAINLTKIKSGKYPISEDAVVNLAGKIRQDVDYRSNEIGIVNLSDTVTVLDFSENCYLIQYGSIIGWIHQMHIQSTPKIKEYKDLLVQQKSIEFEKRLAEIREKKEQSKTNFNKEINNPFKLLITSIKITEINSAGGVSFQIIWYFNNSSKTIKYAYFTVEPYNAVGDKVFSEIGYESTFTGQVTGPIKASSTAPRSSTWENAWYNNTVSCVKLKKVKIEYMDGTSYVFVNELPKILSSDLAECP